MLPKKSQFVQTSYYVCLMFLILQMWWKHKQEVVKVTFSFFILVPEAPQNLIYLVLSADETLKCLNYKQTNMDGKTMQDWKYYKCFMRKEIHSTPLSDLKDKNTMFWWETLNVKQTLFNQKLHMSFSWPLTFRARIMGYCVRKTSQPGGITATNNSFYVHLKIYPKYDQTFQSVDRQVFAVQPCSFMTEPDWWREDVGFLRPLHLLRLTEGGEMDGWGGMKEEKLRK